MSGSLRNHVRWRFANAWLRPASSSDRRLECQLPIEDGPRLPVADRAERRERRVEPLAESPSLVEQAGVELGAGPVRDPLAVGRGLHLEADPGDRAVVAARRGQGRLAAGDGRDLERPTTRRGLAGRSHPLASAPRSGVARRVARARPRGTPLRAGRGRRGRTAARRSRCRARRPAGRAPCRRRGSRALPSPRSLPAQALVRAGAHFVELAASASSPRGDESRRRMSLGRSARQRRTSEAARSPVRGSAARTSSPALHRATRRRCEPNALTTRRRDADHPRAVTRAVNSPTVPPRRACLAVDPPSLSSHSTSGSARAGSLALRDPDVPPGVLGDRLLREAAVSTAHASR